MKGSVLTEIWSSQSCQFQFIRLSKFHLIDTVHVYITGKRNSLSVCHFQLSLICCRLFLQFHRTPGASKR